MASELRSHQEGWNGGSRRREKFKVFLNVIMVLLLWCKKTASRDKAGHRDDEEL